VEPKANWYCDAPEPESHTNVAALLVRTAPWAGLIIFAGDEAVTVRNAVVALLRVLFTAFMVTGKVPPGEFAPVTIVRLVVPGPVSVGGLKLALAPDGNPEALKATVPVSPVALRVIAKPAAPVGPTDWDGGTTDIMKFGANAKVAVTFCGPNIFRYWGFAVPPMLPVNPENVYPELGVALIDACAPLLYQPFAGLMEPPATGLTAVVRKYCVTNDAV
jgi:hypothetical protein